MDYVIGSLEASDPFWGAGQGGIEAEGPLDDARRTEVFGGTHKAVLCRKSFGVRV